MDISLGCHPYGTLYIPLYPQKWYTSIYIPIGGYTNLPRIIDNHWFFMGIYFPSTHWMLQRLEKSSNNINAGGELPATLVSMTPEGTKRKTHCLPVKTIGKP